MIFLTLSVKSPNWMLGASVSTSKALAQELWSANEPPILPVVCGSTLVTGIAM